jgi:hypothetical protein
MWGYSREQDGHYHAWQSAIIASEDMMVLEKQRCKGFDPLIRLIVALGWIARSERGGCGMKAHKEKREAYI